MAVTIRPLDDARAQAWDAFVLAHPDGTFFHRAAWAGVIEAAFGHRTFYVQAERDGDIVGILPLARVKTLLFGDTLISVPFCVYGGPLAADKETAAALSAHAAGLLEKTGASAIEFRHRESVESDWLERPDLYVTFRKQIEAGNDKNMKSIPRKQRAMVRKGIQNNLTSVANGDTGLLHGIYAESVRNLGTPVFSPRYFAILADVFRGDCDVVTIMDGDDAIASVMNFYFRDEVLPYYGGGTSRARHRAANDFMYWEVMRRAADRGCRLFDFGRSKIGTGSHDFKKNWGFAPENLCYRYKLAPGASIPDRNPMNPKYRLFIAGWKHLPLSVANAIGPSIVRGLG
ncbi:MAG: FemAB family PEP-CTERM system-associated protein [Acetobacteraceae bacterium]|nr:FemAB family PEP-CTERM system-associated protein [Acetobacteraceae bacterium]